MTLPTADLAAVRCNAVHVWNGQRFFEPVRIASIVRCADVTAVVPK